MKDCEILQKSLDWCQGTPELPGIKRRVYYISKRAIVKWPTLPLDANGRPSAAAYTGNFTLVESAKWKYIDHLPSKAQVQTETQGEIPSQTVKETVTIVHPATGAEASAACCYLLNDDNIFLVEDMKGNIRVVGSDYYEATATVAQDLGQGATGTAGTTIKLEATDIVSLPVYTGQIVTDDGIINEGASS